MELWQTCPLVSGVGEQDKRNVMPHRKVRLGLTTTDCVMANCPVEVRILPLQPHSPFRMPGRVFYFTTLLRTRPLALTAQSTRIAAEITRIQIPVTTQVLYSPG